MKYRFIDKIIALDPGVTIHAQRTWPADLEIFEDHFPGFPVVPGVLLTEMMGQASGLCLTSRPDQTKTPMLIKIKNASFRGWVQPGEILDVKAEVLSVQEKIARIKATTEREGKLVASAEMLLSFESNDKLGLPAVDPVLEAYWQSQE